MNKEFIYQKGKVIVSNDKGNLRYMDYQDNIREILEQENSIENLENNINTLSSQLFILNTDHKKIDIEIAKNQENTKTNTNFTFFYALLFGISVCLMNNSTSIINVLSNILLAVSTLSEIGITIERVYYKSSKKKLTKKKEELANQIHGSEVELDFSKNLLEKEQEELKALSQKSSSTKKESKGIIKIEDREKLEAQRAYLENMYNCGYNEKKYITYFNKGQLLNKLKEEDQQDIIEIHNYIANKVKPNLIRSLKK